MTPLAAWLLAAPALAEDLEIVVPREVDERTAELVRELTRRAPVKPDR